jgi:hypothetical protein
MKVIDCQPQYRRASDPMFQVTVHDRAFKVRHGETAFQLPVTRTHHEIHKLEANVAGLRAVCFGYRWLVRFDLVARGGRIINAMDDSGTRKVRV